jgi:hypothetical protein
LQRQQKKRKREDGKEVMKKKEKEKKNKTSKYTVKRKYLLCNMCICQNIITYATFSPTKNSKQAAA